MLYSTMYHTKSGWSFKFSNVMTLEGLDVTLNQCKKTKTKQKHKKTPLSSSSLNGVYYSMYY